jgi:electron transfer flavoprotein alpha subunit
MSILVIAEHNQQTLDSITRNTLTAATQLPGDITVLVVGHQCQAVADMAATMKGVQKVILVDAPIFQHLLAENVATLVVELAKDYQYILAPATSWGKNLMPRVAALLDVAMISEIIKVVDPQTFIRPIYAGNALATIKTAQETNVLTVRGSAFAAISATQASAPIETRETAIDNPLSRFVRQELSQSERPELASAKIVVSGGRGMQNGANFKLLEQLADVLKAAIGASRAAVDAGYVPNDYQVGQTGKIIAPDLYFAIGISGAIQHLAGMRESKVIVAINKDADAPIFQIADYGLVGDLFQIVPELITALQKQH